MKKIFTFLLIFMSTLIYSQTTYKYENGSWSPSDPNATPPTGYQDIIVVISGSGATISQDMQIKLLGVKTGETINIENGNVLATSDFVVDVTDPSVYDGNVYYKGKDSRLKIGQLPHLFTSIDPAELPNGGKGILEFYLPFGGTITAALDNNINTTYLFTSTDANYSGAISGSKLYTIDAGTFYNTVSCTDKMDINGGTFNNPVTANTLLKVNGSSAFNNSVTITSGELLVDGNASTFAGTVDAPLGIAIVGGNNTFSGVVDTKGISITGYGNKFTENVTATGNVKISGGSNNEFTGTLQDFKGDILIESANNTFKYLKVYGGKVLNVGANATPITKLDLGLNALLVGTGATCTDVKFTVKPSVLTGGSSTDSGSFWRELGMPFSNNVAVNSVTWGSTYHSNIVSQTGSEDPSGGSYINSWNNSGGTKAALAGTANLPSTVEVYLKGGEELIFNGIDLSQHDADFSIPISTNGGGNWNFIPNPFLSNLDNIGGNLISPNYTLLSGNTASKVSVLVVDGPGAGSYKTVDGFNGGNLGKSNLSVLQGFWVEAALTGNFTISTAAQSSSLSGNLPLAKNNADIVLPSRVVFSLSNDASSDGGLDAMIGLYINDDSPTVGDGEMRLYDASTLNTYPNEVASMFFTRGDHKLGSFDVFIGDLESNSVVEDLTFIGKNAGNYKISISDLDLGYISYNIYLTDKLEGITTKLNDGAYSFTHNPANEANRFEVKITTETLGEAERVEASSIKLINKGNSIEFVMPTSSAIETVQFVSLNGQVVKTVQAFKGQKEFDVTELNSGIYIAQLKLESGNVASYKFVK